MNRTGFTLVELVVVIGIIAILLSLATINFSQWQKKQNISKEITEIYADLMYIRQQALVTGMPHRIQFISDRVIVFRRYSSEADVDSGTGTQVKQKSLPYAVTRSSWSSPSATEIEFNSRGIMVDPVAKSLCIYSDVDPGKDSLVITQSRINLGKIINQENRTCGRQNITIK